MHENIKAIWNRASASYQKADSSWQTQQNFLARFAELIASECARIAETAEPYQSADLIRQHFGVKQ